MGRILIGNIKGPQGLQGPQGIQGPVGPQGPQGPLPPLVNHGLTTEAGIAALDAAMGKTFTDALSELNAKTSAKNFGDKITIKVLGGVVDIPYFVPSVDGYLQTFVESGTSFLIVKLNGEQIVVPQHATWNTINFIFIKAGMNIVVENPPANTGVYFFPLN